MPYAWRKIIFCFFNLCHNIGCKMKHISEIFWADFPEKIVYDSDNLYDPYLVIFQGIA